MSDALENSRATSFNTFLLVPILLFFGLLIAAVLRSPSLISSSGIGGAEIVVAPLILSTYALMAAALAGRATVDLSIGPLIGFINVTLVQLNGHGIVTSPIAVFAYALFAGVAYQFAFALVVIYVRVQPIIVSLSGFLALSGLNLVILPRPGGAAPDWMSAWGAGTSIFSPVLFLVALATVGWWIFTATAFYGHLRLMGSDERAAYTSGVRITVVRLGAHVVAGLFAGVASLAFTGLISSGDPTQGTTYTLISVTALVLGGTSLAGGRASIIGSLLGALNLFLIGYVLATFNFGNVQGFVTDLCYGTILVLSLLLTLVLPHLQHWLRYISPLLVFVVLGLAFVGVALHAKFDYSDLSYNPPVKTKTSSSHAAAPPSVAAKVPSPAALAALKNVDEMSPIFARHEQVTHFERSPFSTAVAQLAILLLAGVVALRLLVWQASKGAMTPVIYAALAFLALVGGWLLMHASIFMAKASN